jgi:hypothetical protein
MQIETLLNDKIENAKALMSKPSANGKFSISLSKLTNTSEKRLDIPVLKTAVSSLYTINELENGTIEIESNGEIISPAKPILREIAEKYNVNILNGNGNPHNTRQLGSLLIRVINETGA